MEGVVTLAPDDHTVVLFAAGGLRLAPVAGVWNIERTEPVNGRRQTATVVDLHTVVQVSLKPWNKRALVTDTMTRIDTHYTDAARNT